MIPSSIKAKKSILENGVPTARQTYASTIKRMPKSSAGIHMMVACLKFFLKALKNVCQTYPSSLADCFKVNWKRAVVEAPMVTTGMEKSSHNRLMHNTSAILDINIQKGFSGSKIRFISIVLS